MILLRMLVISWLFSRKIFHACYAQRGEINSEWAFSIIIYLHSGAKCLLRVKTAGNEGNYQNFDPTLLTKKLWPFNFRMKQKKNFFVEKKNFKMAAKKKAYFSKLSILKIFSRKFLRFVLGLVGLTDAKGIDFAHHIWPWGCPT